MIIEKVSKNDEWEDYYIKSKSSNKHYIITFDILEGTVNCDCEDFKYRRENLKFGGVKLTDKENHCKHIKKNFLFFFSYFFTFFLFFYFDIFYFSLAIFFTFFQFFPYFLYFFHFYF